MKKKKFNEYVYEGLRVGNFKGHNITKSDLNEIVASYSEVNDKAPVVVGHPKDNSPAYGVINKMEVVGDKLMIHATNMKKKIVKAIKNKQLLAQSISLFPRDHDANPTKGKLHVRHSGMLGGKRGAVHGLEPLPEFSDGEDTEFINIDFSESQDKKNKSLFDRFMEWTKREEKNKSQEEIQSYSDNEETTMTKEEQEKFDALKAKVDATEKENKKFKKQIVDFSEEKAKIEKLARTKSIEDFCEKAVKDGNILPADKDMHVQIMLSIPQDEIEFSEEKTSSLDLYQKQIQSKKVNLDFSEKTKDGDGYERPEDKVNQTAKIEKHMKENNMSFSESAVALGVQV